MVTTTSVVCIPETLMIYEYFNWDYITWCGVVIFVFGIVGILIANDGS